MHDLLRSPQPLEGLSFAHLITVGQLGAEDVQMLAYLSEQFLALALRQHLRGVVKPLEVVVEEADRVAHVVSVRPARKWSTPSRNRAHSSEKSSSA